MFESPERQVEGRSVPLTWVMLLALAWITLGLFGREPYKPDEAYTVGLVKSVLDRGDLVVPYLAGEPFLEKPPLFFVTAAGFAAALPGWPLHEAARLATLFYVGLALVAIGASARFAIGAGAGRLAVLLAIACLGGVVRLHQLITDTAQFAGFALALLGFTLARTRPIAGGLTLGLGVAATFLSKGLLGPGVLGCAAVLILAAPGWRRPAVLRAFGVALAVALPIAAAWMLALHRRSPELFMTWLWDNNLGRYFDLNTLGPKHERLFYLKLIVWYGWPAWPLALAGLWRRWKQREDWDALVPALAVLATGLVVLSLASDGRELYALILLPALAVLAADGALGIGAALERWWGRATAVVALAAAAASVVLCAMASFRPETLLRFPRAVALPHMLGPSPVAVVLLVVVLAGTLFLLWRGLAQRGGLALVSAASITLLWGALVLPWHNYLDALKGYRGVVAALATRLPDHGCVASRHLGEPQRALLDYYAGLRTVREDEADARSCAYLIVHQRPGDGPTPSREEWQLLWKGARAGADEEILELFRRR